MNQPARLEIDADRIRVVGAIDFASVVPLERQGADWLRELAPQNCRLDLGAVSRCNSAGTALLLSWSRTARAAGRELTIENIPDSLRGMMLLAGLEDVLPGARHAGVG